MTTLVHPAMPSPGPPTPSPSTSLPISSEARTLLNELKGMLGGLKTDHDALRQRVEAIAAHPALAPGPTQAPPPSSSASPAASAFTPTVHPNPLPQPTLPPTPLVSHATAAVHPDISAFLDPVASSIASAAATAISDAAAIGSHILPGGSFTKATPRGAAAGYPPTKPAGLERFKGRMYVRGVTEQDTYDTHAYQYGTSTYNGDGSMMPKVILYPHCDLAQPSAADDDVRVAIAYAVKEDVAVVCRTGGHQYSGCSSTAGDNIQLDLSESYPQFVWDDAAGLLRVGISHGLTEFNTKLHQLGLFVPTGQCSHVHLGGHVQTGGYGQLCRSFGLFADHVVQIRLILASGEERLVSKGSTDPKEQDLWFGVMGGSPGNWGVVTHATIAPHRDRDHPNSRGLKALYPYHRDALQRLLQLMVDMSEKEELDSDFDFSLSALSGGELVLPFFFPNNLDEAMARYHRDLFGNSGLPVWPSGILVYAQWANLGGAAQPYTDREQSFFDRIMRAAGDPFIPNVLDPSYHTPMSQLALSWVFANVREFPLPFIKRTYDTASTTLDKTGMAKWLADRVDAIETGGKNGLRVSMQTQYATTHTHTSHSHTLMHSPHTPQPPCWPTLTRQS